MVILTLLVENFIIGIYKKRIKNTLLEHFYFQVKYRKEIKHKLTLLILGQIFSKQTFGAEQCCSAFFTVERNNDREMWSK